jgi:hypothetical protein
LCMWFLFAMNSFIYVKIKIQKKLCNLRKIKFKITTKGKINNKENKLKNAKKTVAKFCSSPKGLVIYRLWVVVLASPPLSPQHIYISVGTHVYVIFCNRLIIVLKCPKCWGWWWHTSKMIFFFILWIWSSTNYWSRCKCLNGCITILNKLFDILWTGTVNTKRNIIFIIQFIFDRCAVVMLSDTLFECSQGVRVTYSFTHM